MGCLNKEEFFIAARLKGGDNWTRLATLPLCLHNGGGFCLLPKSQVEVRISINLGEGCHMFTAC